MRRIAYLTSADMVPGQPGARDDLFELENQLAALVPATAARGLSLELRVWDDPGLDPVDYEAIVVGTPWDYQERPAAFLARLDAFAKVRPVLNPPAVLRWNASKTYLLDLQEQGVGVVPTLHATRLDPRTHAAAVARFGTDQLVAKRVVGANAVGQIRLSGGPIPDFAGEVLIQPFLPAIATEGELSFIFVDRAFCHALVKRPTGGDYRVQSTYGGVETSLPPGEEDLATAQAIIDATLPLQPLLYARVDLVRGEEGRLLVMELELIEPYLYPLQGPELGARFAAGLDRLLAQEPLRGLP